MTGSNVDHMDVGAYALGVLSDWEASRFEMHLAGCAACARELEELTLVSSLLSHVDGNSISVVEEYGRDGRAFDRMLNVVSMERRRARTRRVMSMAAAFVLVAAGITYGLVGVSPFNGGGGASGVQGQPPTGRVQPLEVPNEATDKATGAHAKVWLKQDAWGTGVTLKLDHVKGPHTCQLVAVSKSGGSEPVMSWTVGPAGYGSSMAKPDPLTISGSTAMKRSDIVSFEIRVTDGDAPRNPLLTIPIPS
jgi:hypothetical protein